MSFLTDLVDSAISLPQEIAGVALRDPISAVLVAVGSLMLLVSVGVFGGLTLGAVAEALTSSTAREPPREVR